VDTEWLLSTLFDASLLSLEPPENGGSFLFLFQNRTVDEARIVLRAPRHVGDRGRIRSILFACAGLAAAAQAWFQEA
jgi:hypothetical protein